jgi:hexulose-6-phosphate isomerase
MSSSIGLFQGRLTPSKGRGIQFFPNEDGEWEREFEIAAGLGLRHIQWICDPDNPLFDAAFRAKVRAVVGQTGVQVKNMDVQFLTKRDIAACPEALMEKICEALAELKAGQAELPLMEASSLLDQEERDLRLASLARFLAIAKQYEVPIAVESDLPPDKLVDLLKGYPDVSVVYDTGNSAGMGYDPAVEIGMYGDRISNVHVKDKKIGGPTVLLGEGDGDFSLIFQLLGKIGYGGPVTLQAARSEEGKEPETIQKQINFLHSIINESS